MPATTELLGDGGDAIRVLSGDCTVVADGDRREERRGHVTAVVKPDDTRTLLVDLIPPCRPIFSPQQPISLQGTLDRASQVQSGNAVRYPTSPACGPPVTALGVTDARQIAKLT